jgi:hypothetical protein
VVTSGVLVQLVVLAYPPADAEAGAHQHAPVRVEAEEADGRARLDPRRQLVVARRCKQRHGASADEGLVERDRDWVGLDQRLRLPGTGQRQHGGAAHGVEDECHGVLLLSLGVRERATPRGGAFNGISG